MKKIDSFNNIHLKNVLLNLDSIEDEVGKLIGMKIILNSSHEDKIYHKTNGTPVGYFPENLSISLHNELSYAASWPEKLFFYWYGVKFKPMINQVVT